MSKRKYITKQYVVEDSVNEIDFDLYEYFKLKENDTLEIITKPNKKANWSGESYPINVDTLLSMLNNMKEKGCNFVEVMYHTDHIGYVVNGLNIQPSANEELAAHKVKTDQIKRITAEMRELEKQFEAKQKEYKALHNA